MAQWRWLILYLIRDQEVLDPFYYPLGVHYQFLDYSQVFFAFTCLRLPCPFCATWQQLKYKNGQLIL